VLPLRAILWTVLLPGTVAVYLPSVILRRTEAPAPGAWGAPQSVGLLLMIAGTAILLRCIRDFAVVGRGTLSPIDAPRKLVVAGLYRYVRNPMYVGVTMVLVGEVLFFKSLALLEYTVVWFGVVNLFVLFYEEPTLKRRFGESYDRYRRSVGRWIPGRRFDTTQ